MDTIINKAVTEATALFVYEVHVGSIRHLKGGDETSRSGAH
jgi:hypothetical protein